MSADEPKPGKATRDLPALGSGEPVLHRWFAIAMLILVPIGILVVVWAFTSFDRPELDAAARRPPGTAAATHERGQAVLNEDTTAQTGSGCATEIELVGDASARAALQRAVGAMCLLLERPEFVEAVEGLRRWGMESGVLRVGVFELTGVDSTARLEDGVLVIELNAKFQFENAARAAPALLHELVHLARGEPPGVVDAAGELAAIEVQHAACEVLTLDEPPRGCLDAEQLLAHPDPLQRLRDAGYGG